VVRGDLRSKRESTADFADHQTFVWVIVAKLSQDCHNSFVVQVASPGGPYAKLKLLSSGLAPDCARVYLSDGDAILKVSPPDYPNVVRELTQKFICAREALGPELAWAVPVLLDEGEIDGVSWARIEHLMPLSQNRLKRFLQLRRVIPLMLAWLRKVAELDRGGNNQAEQCLDALTGCPYAALNEPAKDALASLKGGKFVPRSRIMHSDLLLGNVLLDPGRIRDFVIIDWRGSNVDGFPIFDLVKFADSAKMHPRTLQSELSAHAERLGCSVNDTRSYLLAALGYIWRNLDQFPPDRFAIMGERCLKTIDSALNG
jgi:hypothetical protein